MGQVRFTRRAREDLIDIWLYIAERNPKIADTIYDRIEARCGRLQTYPEIGRARPEIAKDARSLVIDRWLLLYRVMKSGVQVVRIIDSARDIAMIDWTPE